MRPWFSDRTTVHRSWTCLRNLLEFNLSKVVFAKSLNTLDLNHNIYGSIPVEITALKLQFFNVSYNRLCVQIPIGGKLQNFDYLTYFHNQCLSGAPLASCKRSYNDLPRN
ncbi:polygalacturonase inhibitor [Quercus suber]|uniref:Polygalacturonase inhibitor n=1 Tax=Quercus suber TaxID=58331 RepID=A0AAW0JGW0_QUESU|nr:polygalacturonase inhibitor [Quercus suber]